MAAQLGPKTPKFRCSLLKKNKLVRAWWCPTKAQACREVEAEVRATKGYGEVLTADPNTYPQVEIAFNWYRGKLNKTVHSE